MAVFAASDLKKWRKDQGISPADLAELVSCDTGTIYRYESGKLKPNPDVMYQICEALGDITKWCDWMRTEYPTSYARVHPECTTYELPGALMSLFAEMPDVMNLRDEVLRDAADGKIDDKELAARLIKEITEVARPLQRVMNLLKMEKNS